MRPVASSAIFILFDCGRPADPLNDAQDIRERLEHALAGVIDAGACPLQPTTIVDLTDGEPVVLRQGCGSVAALGL